MQRRCSFFTIVHFTALAFWLHEQVAISHVQWAWYSAAQHFLFEIVHYFNSYLVSNQLLHILIKFSLLKSSSIQQQWKKQSLKKSAFHCSWVSRWRLGWCWLVGKPGHSPSSVQLPYLKKATYLILDHFYLSILMCLYAFLMASWHELIHF